MPNSIVWTAQEDEALRHLVLEYGDKRWSLIADKLRTNKGSKQCRRRWKNCLSLDVKKGSWSEEEDDILQKAHAVHGNRWTLIAKLVGGRTDNAVKNRWAALARRKNANGVKRSKRGKLLSRQQEGQSQANGQNTDLDNVLVETRSGSGGFPKPDSSLAANTPECRNGQGIGKHLSSSGPPKVGPSMGLRMGGLEPTSNFFPSCAPTSISDGLLLNLPTPGNDSYMGSSEHKNLVAQELQTLNYMNDLASPRALLGELMKRDMSFPSMSNRDEVDSLRCPCFTHSELDMLLTALQTCPP
ncbi:hypothetical protein BSKO_05414 [Bryopsis sp. KO-2023]|nr:hypothetical protein BSKO_05414 [Bryopsis sp. KO-2023]